MKILNFSAANLFILWWFFAPITIDGQKIISGPIQGHTTDTSAIFWVLLKNASSFNLSLKGAQDKGANFTINEDSLLGALYKNKRAFKYTLYQPLGEEKVNQYSIVLNKKDTIKQVVVLSGSTDSTFMFGSCAYIGKGFSRVYRPWNMTKIFKTMSKEQTKNMLWMGDNVYLILEHDLKNNKSIYRRYVGVRKQKNMNRLLSSKMQHYSTWDDHDFGPNNTDGSYEKASLTTNAFNSFWVNPKNNSKGIYYSFCKGKTTFFMTDGRTFKNNDGSALLGNQQMDWLKSALLNSSSTYKIIVLGNQLINAIDGHESYYDCPEERQEIMRFINDNEIPGVLFFSGDRHHSEINVEHHLNYYPIHDITCSALSSPRPKFRGWGKERTLSTRVDNSFITKHNYCIVTVNSDCLVFKFKNKSGRLLFNYTVPQKELGY